MLREQRRHPLLAAAVEVLADATRYVAIMVVLVVLVGYIARLAAGSP
jgi:hypothetical protein